MEYNKLRVIYYDADIIVLSTIIWGLLQLDIDVVRSDINVELATVNDIQVELIRKEVKNYDLAISQNFSVNVAIACHDAGIPYISWIYDSPQVALFTKHALYPENYVFAFDRAECDRLKALGLKNVFHQPLCANIAYTSGINVSDDDIRKYKCDLSFIGQMYRVDSFEQFKTVMPEDLYQNVSDVIEKHALNWEPGSNIFGSFSKETVDALLPYINEKDFSYFNTNPAYIEEVFLLGPGIAQKERAEILNEASKLYKVNIFTRDTDVEYAKKNTLAKVFPHVSDEVPYKIYYSSKVNLNLTLRTIETGIPLRIFDIMSVGGFVMSNYQEEIPELFEPDKEIVLFSSMDEFKDKLKFYLNHNDLRTRIAVAGYQKVRDNYDCPTVLAQMFAKL